MAIVIEGKTPCLLCWRVIEAGQEIVGFPAFVTNELDPLLLFNDAAFHEECFIKHPLAEKVLKRVEELRRRTGPGNRFCVVCGKEITNPDDYFTMGYLVDDPHHPLYHYNYTQAHHSHLPKWAELPYVYELIEDLKQSGTWRGETLDKLSDELRIALPFTLSNTGTGKQ